ncbi:unnamed protein product [Cuscuta europaea]|uniref:Leucine-rich repeat extensin-like protein 3 n=1 Tax=Cuscuta europaea TaxID=41803 RepID=A0A9P0ZMM2_CUSEU|nr:unnamed protein product [Cuscuta europaea]
MGIVKNVSFLMSSVMMVMVLEELDWKPLMVGATNTTWVGSKYQVECIMCAACDNPCDAPSPPPPTPPPPPPYLPPATVNCPPPPPPPRSPEPYYYSSPPPPRQEPPSLPLPPSCYNYPSAGCVIGGYIPPPYNPFPSGQTPPPPNPIMPYFPFYFHIPPPPHSSQSSQLFNPSLPNLIIITIHSLFLYFIM